jgi:hypothetical protein
VGRRIGGAGGGSDKGGGAGTFLLAALLAIAVGTGGTSALGIGSAGGGASASSGARGQSNVSSRQSQAAEARIVARGVQVRARATDDSTNCAAHAYGQVKEYLREHPCVGMHRASFELRDAGGDVVLIAVSWVDMGDEATAREFHRLVDGSGTGNITELSRERGRYRSVRFTGDIYESRREGTVVSNAQAQPVGRGATGLALTSIVTNALR